jgi:hypothetical protein
MISFGKLNINSFKMDSKRFAIKNWNGQHCRFVLELMGMRKRFINSFSHESFVQTIIQNLGFLSFLSGSENSPEHLESQ